MCLTICDPKDCSTPGCPVHHQLPELIHVHRVSGDDIQPCHRLLSPSPPAFHLSQHQGFSSESVFHIRWPEYWRFSFIQRGTKAEDMGESLSWERPPKVLLGHILNGFKSLLGKKKNKDSVKEGRRGEREKRGKRDQVTTRFKYHLQLAQQAKKCGND